MSERLLTVAEVLAYEAGYDARSEEVTAEIARLTAELDVARERERVRDQAAQALCTIYFEIAAEAFGEDEVRRIRDECINALASTPPDTEGDDV